LLLAVAWSGSDCSRKTQDNEGGDIKHREVVRVVFQVVSETQRLISCYYERGWYSIFICLYSRELQLAQVSCITLFFSVIPSLDALSIDHPKTIFAAWLTGRI
jgi:hypothetical protein